MDLDPYTPGEQTTRKVTLKPGTNIQTVMVAPSKVAVCIAFARRSTPTPSLRLVVLPRSPPIRSRRTTLPRRSRSCAARKDPVCR